MAPTDGVVATLGLPAEEAARLLGTGPGEVRPIDAHSCRPRGHAATVEWSAARLLMLGGDFQVPEPPELVAHLHAPGGARRQGGRGHAVTATASTSTSWPG
ncbi:hypothetical protein [Marinactinospora rubrisoli]|uniref:WCX domain-containing protein n=1 Tax=Marinactinospora rubrisoli TaxID=2715399 RepID=A0ABW2KLM5_9ACTN